MTRLGTIVIAGGAKRSSRPASDPVRVPCASRVDKLADNGVVVNGARRAVSRLGAAAGIAGPAAFTGAWIASSLRQTRQGPGGLQLSGLAAPDARDPWIMVAGFLALGGCTFVFGAALRVALGRNAGGAAGPGPALVQCAGLLTVAAGLLRRDHMLLTAPGEPGASWHSNAHDAISGLVYVSLVAAQLALARRFRRDPAWRPWYPWLLASAAATGVILIAYTTDVTGPAAAILQRVAVTLPQAAVVAIAARLMWRPTGPNRSGPRHRHGADLPAYWRPARAQQVLQVLVEPGGHRSPGGPGTRRYVR